MPDSLAPPDSRKSPRTRLRLPARIRWLGPLGMRLEVTETIDASREGLLVRRPEPCNRLTRVWVAYPFDPSATDVQPETPARIARVQAGADGSFYVGLQLQLPPRDSARPPDGERRRSARFSFALPIFVRPSGSLWPEESMTRNISKFGVRFETARVYKVGETVRAKIPWGEWAKGGEISGRVVRLECAEETGQRSADAAAAEAGENLALASVAVEWLSTPQHHDVLGTRLPRATKP